MPSGSCLCGNLAFNYTGDVQAQALCHCADCKKQSGSSYSTNIIVPGDGLEVTKGKAKEYAKRADNGNTITSYFCGDCGSTLFRKSPTFGDSVVVKVGVMDDTDALEKAKPGAELYVPQRVSWIAGIPGTGQKKGMPDSEDV